MQTNKFLTGRRLVLLSASLVPIACAGGGPADGTGGFGWADGDYYDGGDYYDEDAGGGPSGGASNTGGASTGGANTGGSGPDCNGINPYPETHLCAGYAWEQTILGHTWSNLEPQSAAYACGDPYYPGTGGYTSSGGATGTGGSGFGGEAPGGDGWVDTPAAGEAPPSLQDWTSSTGGHSAGGAPATGGYGTGGEGGGASTGGTTGVDPAGPHSNWCADLSEGTNIAGVSYRVGDCRVSDLKLPIRFQEPQGWYELRVYTGTSACDRGVVTAEMAGYGLGQVIEIPVTVSGEAFVSLELRSDYGWSSAAVELNQLTVPVD